MGRDADEIFHQRMGIGKRRGGQTLEDIADAVALLGLTDHTESIVDVALTVPYGTHKCGREIIGLQNLSRNGVRILWKNAGYGTSPLKQKKDCDKQKITV